jgi:hypothetical protein
MEKGQKGKNIQKNTPDTPVVMMEVSSSEIVLNQIMPNHET